MKAGLLLLGGLVLAAAGDVLQAPVIVSGAGIATNPALSPGVTGFAFQSLNASGGYTPLGVMGMQAVSASLGSAFIVTLPAPSAPFGNVSVMLIVAADGTVTVPVGDLVVTNGIVHAKDVQIANGWSLYNTVSGLIAGVTALAVINIVLLCHVFSTSSAIPPLVPEDSKKALVRV